MNHSPPFRDCPEQHGPAFCIIDHEENLLHWNRAFACLTGIPLDPGLLSITFTSVIQPATPLASAASLTDQAPRNGHGHLKSPDGQATPVTFFVHPIPDDSGRHSYVRLILLHERGEPLFQDAPFCRVERRYQHIFEMSHRGLAKFAADGSLLFANQAFSELLGWPDSNAVQGRGMRWWEANCPVPAQYRRLFEEIRERGNVSKFELDVLAGDGKLRKLLLDAYVPDERDEDAFTFIAVIEDVTDQQTTERQLLRQTFSDQLTGLPNKAFILDRIETALRKSRQSRAAIFALAFVDVDEFKVINQTYGNVLGDQILVQISRKIQQALRERDILARYGDDEFVILLDKINDEREAMNILEQVKHALASPLTVTDQLETVCSVSIGLVLSPGYDSALEMLRDADRARYRFKVEKNGFAYPSPPPITLFRKPDLTWEDFLRAMDQSELLLHYQPIHQISDNALIGFEALLRWNHPRHGLLHPPNFLPLPEPAKIELLTEWMLDRACSQMHAWHRAYDCDSLAVTVNMTAEQFVYPELPATLLAVFETSELATCNLKLEFSRMALNRFEDFGELCMRIKELDIQLAVDDFGTGYSTLLSLQRYPFVPIDTLQVNRRVITRLTDNSYYQEMVWATIMLAHSLGVEVEADGVDAPEQLDLLREMHCDSAKGSLFSRPLMPEAAEKLIQERFTPRSLPN